MNKLFLVTVFLIILTGCINNANTIESLQNDIEAIKIDIIDIHTIEDGVNYNFRITNESDRMIKYIEMEVGFDPTDEARKQRLNNLTIFNTRASEPFNIEPDDQKYFSLYISKALINESNVDLESIDVFVTGYFDSIDIDNRFMFSGGIERYNSDSEE